MVEHSIVLDLVFTASLLGLLLLCRAAMAGVVCCLSAVAKLYVQYLTLPLEALADGKGSFWW